MKRSYVYLTTEQQERLDGRAKDLGVTKAEVIRQLLDKALGIAHPEPEIDKVLMASFGLWADRSDEEIDEILSSRRDVPFRHRANL